VSAPHRSQGRPPSQAAPSPRAHAPRLLRVLLGRAPQFVRAVPAERAPRTTGPTAVPRCTRAGLGWVPRRHPHRPLPSPRSRAAPINTPAFPPSSAGIATPPHHPHCRRGAAPLHAFHGRATTHVPSLDPIEPSRATCCLGRARAVAGAEPPRPPPLVLALRPRRRVLRPNTSNPQALGEPTDMPCRFPGREHGRLAEIWPAPPPPIAKGRIASPQLFLGCFV
jgi:hypothetical protein